MFIRYRHLRRPDLVEVYGRVYLGSISAEDAEVISNYVRYKNSVGDSFTLRAGIEYSFVEKDLNTGRPKTIKFSLSHDLRVSGAIDITKINSGLTVYADNMLAQAKNQKFVSHGLKIISDNSDDEYEAKYLKHGLVARNKADNIVYIDVIDQDKLVGKGAFGEVADCLGTVKLDPHHQIHPYIFKQHNKRRVVKLQQYKSAKTEHDKTSLFRYFSLRELVVPQNRGIFSMRRFKGKTLKEYIDKDLYALSEYDLYSISIAVLRSLKLLHEKKIAHRDVKPENVMLYQDPDTKLWTAKMIDLGLAASSNEDLNESKGTPLFLAPEVLTVANLSEHRYQSDIYSMGRTLADLFGDIEIDAESDGASLESFLLNRATKHDVKLELKFISSVPEDRRALVTNVLNAMIHFEPQSRMQLDSAIHTFEELRLQSFLFSADESLHSLIKHNHAKAVMLLKHMQLLVPSSNPVNFKLAINRVKKDVMSLFDCEQAISLFVHTLGISMLSGCRSKGELIERLDILEDLYSQSRKAIEDMFKVINTLYDSQFDVGNGHSVLSMADQNSFDVLVESYKLFKKKIAIFPTDLDEILEQSEQVTKKYEKLIKDFEYYAGLIDEAKAKPKEYGEQQTSRMTV